MGPADLKAALTGLEPETDPNLLVGITTGDDAGVYLVAEGLALVSTVDFFTPVVDDPFVYGQIGAANALSDIYAMGGTPRTALNIVCWPQSGMPEGMLAEILRGGSTKAHEAGVAIVGGHSVADEEIKYGMAVSGVVDPKRVVRNVGVREGDLLLLTKPLGTGILTTALKRDALARHSYAAAVRTMTTLNVQASRAMLRHDVHAATDITGFGLLGHAMPMAEGSGVTIVFEETDLPIIDGTIEACRAGMVPGGAARNREFFGPRVRVGEDVGDEVATIAFDPETSGGLLIALPEEEAIALLGELEAEGNLDAAIVGRATAAADTPIVLK